MNTLAQQIINENQDVIVAFKIGRGGRFNNPGNVKLIGEYPISHFTDNLFLKPSNWKSVFAKIQGKENLTSLYEAAMEGDQLAFNRLKALGLDLGENEYFSENGHAVGLTEKEAESGIGRIDIDGEYDTTFTIKLGSFDEVELGHLKEFVGYPGFTLSKLQEALNQEIEENIEE